MVNGYEPLLTDEGLCRDCDAFCWQPAPTPTPCEVDGCVCERCARARRPIEPGETVGQLYDRVQAAGGVLHAYGRRWRTPREQP